MAMNVSYWRKRNQYRYLHYTNQVSKIEKELDKYYRQYWKELKQQVNILQMTVVAHPSINNQAKLDYAQEQLTIIETILNNLNNTVSSVTTTYLVNNYIWQMTSIIPDLEKTLSHKLMWNVPDGKVVEEIIRQNWSGLTYSERIWRNSQNLAYNLKEVLLNGVIKGSSYDTMVKELSQRMGTSRKNTYRLVKTELKAAISRADVDTYERAGVKWVQNIISGKDNVCKECRRKNLQKVPIAQAKPGITIAPFHPNCTCTVIPFVSLKVPTTSDEIILD